MVFFTLNSYEQDNTRFPRNNSYNFRDSSADFDGESTPSTPTSPTSPTSSVSQSNDTALNKNNNTPNLQRRASESVTDIQFKKLPARRYTLPSKFGLPLSRFWEAGRDSSVQVAMDNVQFGL